MDNPRASSKAGGARSQRLSDESGLARRAVRRSSGGPEQAVDDTLAHSTPVVISRVTVPLPSSSTVGET